LSCVHVLTTVILTLNEKNFGHPAHQELNKVTLRTLKRFVPKIFPRSDVFKTCCSKITVQLMSKMDRMEAGVTLLVLEKKRIENVVLLEALVIEGEIGLNVTGFQCFNVFFLFFFLIRRESVRKVIYEKKCLRSPCN